MDVELRSDNELLLSNLHAAGLQVACVDDQLHFGGVHMMVASLGLCTFSLLATWGERFDTPATDVTVQLRWKYEQKPYRVGHVDMDINWPGLPEERLDAAMRVAVMCTVHNTLMHEADVETMIGG